VPHAEGKHFASAVKLAALRGLSSGFSLQPSPPRCRAAPHRAVSLLRPPEAGGRCGGAGAASPQAVLRRRFWKGTGSASSGCQEAHCRPPLPRWLPMSSHLLIVLISLPAMFFLIPAKFIMWLGVPHPLFCTSYLTLCISLYLSNVPPCSPRAWPGLHPTQKLSAGLSVTALIKPKLLCALTKKTSWKTRVRKSPTLPLSSSK